LKANLLLAGQSRVVAPLAFPIEPQAFITAPFLILFNVQLSHIALPRSNLLPDQQGLYQFIGMYKPVRGLCRMDTPSSYLLLILILSSSHKAYIIS
jgi:hypothetical protein